MMEADATAEGVVLLGPQGSKPNVKQIHPTSCIDIPVKEHSGEPTTTRSQLLSLTNITHISVHRFQPIPLT